MRVSLITACYNSADTIQDTFNSVRAQDYSDIEYIVVDGGSTDGTIDLIKQNQDLIDNWISESDEGIYDAMNKGFQMSTGDIVGTLNSDDVLAGFGVITRVVDNLGKNKADVCWGDLVYVVRDDLNKVLRTWKSSPYESGKFELGWHPPHPTFYARRKMYEKCGYFNTDFMIAADYELMLRFLEVCGAKSCYVPGVMVKMRTGGTSNKSIKNIIKANIEVYKAWRINNLRGGLLAPLLKPLSKIFQYKK